MDRKAVRRLDARTNAASTTPVNTRESAPCCVDRLEDLNATARKRVILDDSVKFLFTVVPIIFTWKMLPFLAFIPSCCPITLHFRFSVIWISHQKQSGFWCNRFITRKTIYSVLPHFTRPNQSMKTVQTSPVIAFHCTACFN